MDVSNFSSLLELAATLNIALVAVEYAKTYTHILAKNVFKFDVEIESAFKKYEDIFSEKERLSSFQPIFVGGGSTNNMIEEARRKLELFEEKFIAEKDGLHFYVNNACNSRSLSSLSLYLFLFCVLILFLGGIISINMIVKSIIMQFTLLSFIYLLIGWFSGEKQKIYLKCFSFSSIRHNLVIFGILFLLALLICCICFIYLPYDYTGNLWGYFIIVTVLLPFSNFFVFFFKTKNKAKSIKLHIINQSNSINDDYNIVKEKINNLKAVNSVASQVAFPVNESQLGIEIKSNKFKSEIVNTNQCLKVRRIKNR
ncbi:hypothetical protein [Macellibacteroides fermentans]